MKTIVTQMAAMSAAMRVLLAGDPLAKPAELMIGASNEVTQPLIEMMMHHAANGRTTFLALFHIDGDTALLERIMVVDGTTTKRQINVGGGKFIQKADGSFAIASISTDDPYEYILCRNGWQLRRRSASNSIDRALMELRGMQALVTEAASAACQAEADSASVTHC